MGVAVTHRLHLPAWESPARMSSLRLPRHRRLGPGGGCTRGQHHVAAGRLEMMPVESVPDRPLICGSDGCGGGHPGMPRIASAQDRYLHGCSARLHAIVVSTPSDVSLQDARKAIEMFRQMKVDLVGMVENMSYFVCPHCNHQTDIFSARRRVRRRNSLEFPTWAKSSSIPTSARPATADGPRCSTGKSPHPANRFSISREK